MLGNFDLNPSIRSSSMRSATYRPSLDALAGRPTVGTGEDTVTLRVDPPASPWSNASYDEAARRNVAYHIQRTIYDDVPVISSVSDAQDWIMNTDLQRFNLKRTTPYDDFMKVVICC